MKPIALLILSGLLLAGCGGDSGSDGAPAPGNNPPPDDTPETPGPEPEPPFRPEVVQFIAIGDSGTGSPGQYAVGEAIADVCARKATETEACELVVGFGDNIYESGVSGPTDSQFDEKFEKPFAPVELPFYMVLGNHDNTGYVGGDGADNARGEHQVSYHYRDGRMTDRWHMPERYYREPVGLTSEQRPLVEFFALDSNPIASMFADADHRYSWQQYGMVQLNWVIDAMINSTATFKVAMAHHPYLSNGQHGNAGNYDGIPGELLPVVAGKRWQDFLEEGVCDRADFFMAGHDHDLQALEAVDRCGRTEFIVSGAAGKTRELGDRSRNPARYQADNTYGFFWFRAVEANPETGAAAQMCAEAYEVDPEAEGLGVISGGSLSPAWRHCYDKVAAAGISHPDDFSGTPFTPGSLPDLGEGSDAFDPAFTGPLAEYRDTLVSGINRLITEMPAEARQPAAEITGALDTLMVSLDAAAAAVTGDEDQAGQALWAIPAAAARLAAVDTSSLPAPYDQLDDAFAAFADGVGAGGVGGESGDASRDIAFLAGPLVQLARNLENIIDGVDEQTDEVPVIAGLTHALASVARGTALALEDLSQLDSSGAGEAVIGHISEALTAVAEDMLLLNQAPAPVGDNATLPGDALSDALMTVAREVTEQLDNRLLSPLDGLLDVLAPVTGALADLLDNL